MSEPMTEDELLRGLAPLTGEPFDELAYLIDALRKRAASTSETSKFMAEMRTAEYRARGDLECAYQWLKPEQTSEWKAAEAMQRMRTALEAIANAGVFEIQDDDWISATFRDAARAALTATNGAQR